MAPPPAQAPSIVAEPQWAPIGVVPPWQQVGRYAKPPQTQVAGYWPDIQLKCGVEGMRPAWDVQVGSGSPSAPAIPYFQQSAYPVNPRQPLLDGRRPGAQLGPAQVSALLGPQRRAEAKQLKALAAGWLGW